MAPSVSPAELPAVTRPPARNGVRSPARPSSVVSGRRNSSRVGEAPALLAEDAHGDDGARHDPVVLVPGPGGPALALERVAVRVLPRQLREGVVEVLGRLPHHGGALVDQPLADEARVELDLGAHRVMPHVLDAADEHEVGRAHRDLAGACGRRRQRARAHAVDSEARHRVRQSGEQGHVAAERQALVAHLRRGGQDDVADPLGRNLGLRRRSSRTDLDGHVVGAGLPEEPAGPALPKAVRTPSTKTTSRSSRAMGGGYPVDR